MPNNKQRTGIFGSNAGIKFDATGNVTVVTNGQLNTLEGCAALSDTNGNLQMYNDGNQRSAMFYGDDGVDKANKKIQKFYSADGSMEIKYDANSGKTEFTTYVAGDAYSAPLFFRGDVNEQTAMFLHRDYQGSILAITDLEGKVLESRYFDAWGNISFLANSNGDLIIKQGIIIDPSYQMLTDRG